MRGHRGFQPRVLRERFRNALAAAGAAPPSFQVGLSGTWVVPGPSAGRSSSSTPCRIDGSRKSILRWRVHREATVTARSIVGGHSLGVRTGATAHSMTYFRCRKSDTNSIQLKMACYEHEASGPIRRAPRDRCLRTGRADPVTEVGLLVYRPRGARRPKGHREREVQWRPLIQSRDSGSSSDAPIEPGAHGESGISMNPIVLVSRVSTGRPGAAKLRQRRGNSDSLPLPFFMTIRVSFEPAENSSALARSSIRCLPRSKATCRARREFGRK